jgi:hypothetical protein
MTLVNFMFSQPYYNRGNGKLGYVASIYIIIKSVIA